MQLLGEVSIGPAIPKFVFGSAGVAVKAGVSSNQLDIMFVVSENYTQVGNRGLFGVHNGDPSDDLTTPDGTVISANKSEDLEFIHNEFGEKCESAALLSK